MRKPRYILVKAEDLSVTLVDACGNGEGLYVPTKIENEYRSLSPLERVLYYDVLYKDAYAEDRKQGHNHIRYRLMEPEPWMIALAGIMWQGIVQGMTWDAIRLLVHPALEFLQHKGLAPKESKRDDKSSSENVSSLFELGFSYSEYADGGKKTYDMFLGLRRVYERSSVQEREDISKSVVVDNEDDIVDRS